MFEKDQAAVVARFCSGLGVPNLESEFVLSGLDQSMNFQSVFVQLMFFPKTYKEP